MKRTKQTKTKSPTPEVDYKSCPYFIPDGCTYWVDTFPDMTIRVKNHLQLAPATIESLAEGFAHFADFITKEANKYAYQQDDLELPLIYDRYEKAVSKQIALVKRHLDIDLPEPPARIESESYFETMCRLAKWCKKAAKGAWLPLTTKARLIRAKLESLPEGDAMTLPQIQKWYENEQDDKELDEETSGSLDEGTWKHIRKELLPYGLKNKPRIGYYFPKITL